MDDDDDEKEEEQQIIDDDVEIQHIESEDNGSEGKY